MNLPLRRLIALLVVTTCLVVVPQLAVAAFSGRATSTQTVSTASLSQPTSISGTWACEARVFLADRARVATTGLDGGANPAGTVYRYELLNGNRLISSATATSPTAPVSLEGQREDSSRTWTVRVRPELRSWNTPWTESTFTCRALISTDGTL
ncbi:hypothetical protein [Nocardioides sp. W7]|uniref:hypothetical protein n=1 Tax=Nocardioides sp. W7 TaxID=2931390 RepID=UPI001FD3D673|nr:hypothetical protein [Nocardioides sp. W7]